MTAPIPPDAAPPSGPPDPSGAARPLAAFDFDGTLAKRDCLFEFLVRFRGLARVTAAFAADTPLLAATARGAGSRDELKARVFGRVLAGTDADELAAAGEEFAGRIHRRLLRPEMLAAVESHRAQGHELVIVSASLHAYLDPLGDRLGFDRVIAVELATDPTGRLTGEMVGGNCRGPEKVRRLEAAVGPLAGRSSWGYGDSDGDAALLAAVAHPTWVGRKADKMAAKAAAAGVNGVRTAESG